MLLNLALILWRCVIVVVGWWCGAMIVGGGVVVWWQPILTANLLSDIIYTMGDYPEIMTKYFYQ